MKRREFAAALGVAVFPSLLGKAEAEFQQTGEVSAETAVALLDAQGERGIFSDPKHLAELRAALGRKFRDHKIIREFKVPEDVQPLTYFRR